MKRSMYLEYGTRLILLIVLLSACYGNAQSGNCDYALNENDLDDPNVNIIWGAQLNLAPGSTICIPAGSYKAFRFYDLNGTPENPIIIRNSGGLVSINASSYSGISLQRCSNVRITGTGDDNFEYGIKVAHTNDYSSGIYLENFTTDVELDYVEIEDAGFAGIMGKTDPYCDNPETWRSSGFIMKNINIHHNYIHNVGGEGIYLGFTGGYMVDSNRACDGTPIFGHWLENVAINDNKIEDTGLDGIQVNLARENCLVYNNIITNYAWKEQGFQDFAMSLGGGVYQVYNNRIYNHPGYKGRGLQLISATSGTNVYNNIIVSPKFHGIFVHQRHEYTDLNEGIKVYNNTIVKPEQAGIFYNNTITSSDNITKLGAQQNTVPAYFVNNLILDPGNHFEGGNTWKQGAEDYIDFNDRSTRDAMLAFTFTNMNTRSETDLDLVIDDTDDSYAIASYNSPLVDAGTDISSFGLTSDIVGNPRSEGRGYDIGAFEYMFPDGFRFMDEDVKIQAYPNPATRNFALNGATVKGSQVQVFNNIGTLLYNNTNYNGSIIDVSQFENGYYFVNVTGNGKQKTIKLLVSN